MDLQDRKPSVRKPRSGLAELSDRRLSRGVERDSRGRLPVLRWMGPMPAPAKACSGGDSVAQLDLLLGIRVT